MTEIQDHTERRLQIQVYQEWARVAKAKPFPSMEDMEEVVLEGFHEDSVILQMTEDAMDPIIAFVGSNLRRDCGKGTRIERLPDVPGLTLLSRFTDTYLQCIANRAPVGFEASFINCLEENVHYRGILLPISSDGQNVDTVWGVTSSKSEPLADFAAMAEELELIDEVPAAAPSNDNAAAPVATGGDVPSAEAQRLAQGLTACRDIDGLVGLALVDIADGAVGAQLACAGDLDLAGVAASGAELIRLKREVIAQCGLAERFEEAIVTTRRQFWLLQPLEGGEDLLVLAVLDRDRGNLANARRQLGQALMTG
ncbi:MAG: hypothetical protein VYD90_00200 [Pseudomonadota bacterium]|nr:hypothetical protein [Pseudomonadota bacterium]